MKFFLQTLLLLVCTISLFSQELDQNNIELEEMNFVDFENDHEDRKPFGNHGHEGIIDIGELEPVLSAESEPLTTVKGCVNILSGQFFQVDNDLISQSIEPINLVRTYDSGNENESSLGFGFGTQFPIWASDLQDGARHCYVLISEREGFSIPYRGKSFDHEKICEIDARLLKKGYTNMSRAAIAGHANFINWKAVFRTKNDHPFWSVKMGDGTYRIYNKQVFIHKEHKERMNFPTHDAYLLTKEIKPNGNHLNFHYKTIHHQPRLVKIEALDRNGKAILDILQFDYTPEGCTVSNAAGDSVKYNKEDEICTDHKERKVLKNVSSSQLGEYNYHSKIVKKQRKMTKVEKPDGRFVEVDYNHDGKVKSLIEPLGPNGEGIKSAQFNYVDDKTIVTNSLGYQKVYTFDKNQRLLHIKQKDEQNNCTRHEDFLWSPVEGQEGWLNGKAVRGDGDQLYHLKTYNYDDRGNITRATIYGNLTGEASPTFTFIDRKNAEHYSIEYTYIDKQRNLLKSKKTPEGLETIYQLSSRYKSLRSHPSKLRWTDPRKKILSL